MAKLFILQNQHGYFLGKQGDWLDGRQPNSLFRTLHKDEAINQQFEAGSQDYSLRITSVQVEGNAKGQPILPEDMLPELAQEEHTDSEADLKTSQSTSAESSTTDVVTSVPEFAES